MKTDGVTENYYISRSLTSWTRYFKLDIKGEKFLPVLHYSTDNFWGLGVVECGEKVANQCSSVHHLRHLHVQQVSKLEEFTFLCHNKRFKSVRYSYILSFVLGGHQCNITMYIMTLILTTIRIITIAATTFILTQIIWAIWVKHNPQNIEKCWILLIIQKLHQLHKPGSCYHSSGGRNLRRKHQLWVFLLKTHRITSYIFCTCIQDSQVFFPACDQRVSKRHDLLVFKIRGKDLKCLAQLLTFAVHRFPHLILWKDEAYNFS